MNQQFKINFLKSRGVIFDFIGQLERKNIMFDKEGLDLTIDFMNRIVSSNPYLGLFCDNLSVGIVYDEVLNYNNSDIRKLASYVGQNKIMVSSRYIYDVLTGKESLASLISTLGHERQHFIQELLIKNKVNMGDIQIPEDVKLKIDEMAKDFNSKELSAEDFYNIMSLMQYTLDSDYINNFKKLNKIEQIKLCKRLSFSQYEQFKHEENARDVGFDFAQEFFENVLKDHKIDKFMINYFKEQIENIKKFKLYENNSRGKIYTTFKDFDKELDKITEDYLYEIESRKKEIEYFLIPKKIYKFNGSTYELKIVDLRYEFNKAYDEVLSFMSKKLFEKCENDELKENFYYSFMCGFYSSANEILKLLAERNLPETERKELKVAVMDMLSQGDFEPKMFNNVSYSAILSEDEILDIIFDLFEQDKFITVENLYHSLEIDMIKNNVLNFDNINEKLGKKFLIKAKDYLKRLKAKDESLVLKDYYTIINMIDSISRNMKNKKLIQALIEIKKSFEEQKPFYDDFINEIYHLQYDNLTNVYGEKICEDERKEDEYFSILSDFKLEKRTKEKQSQDKNIVPFK